MQKSTTVTVSATPPPPPTGTFTEGMVTISFDDAWTTHYTQALPILNTAGLKGTFYILTEPVQGGWSDYMSPMQVKAIAQSGHDIQGHTVTHVDLTTVGSRRIDKELQDSKKYLESLVGGTITSLAYPYGSYNTTTISRAKLAGYTNARSADPTIALGFNTGLQSKFEINSFSPNTAVSVASIKTAIAQAKQNKQWFVLSYHQIENGSSDEYTTSVANFQEIVNYIKSSGIKVVTMREGAALLK